MDSEGSLKAFLLVFKRKAIGQAVNLGDFLANKIEKRKHAFLGRYRCHQAFIWCVSSVMARR